MIYKKYASIILITILSLFILNYLAYLVICIHSKLNIFETPFIKRQNFSVQELEHIYEFRNPVGLEYSKNPSIIIFGCGITNFYISNEDEMIQTPLSKYTKRPVYNRAIGGGGIQHAILQVQSKQMDNIIKNSDNAIYILSALNDNIRLRVYPGPLIDAHYNLDTYLYPHFKNSNGKLTLYKTNIPSIKGSVLYRFIEKIILTTLYTIKFQKINLYKNNIEFAILHFKTLNQELKAINPNIKFSIIFYYENINDKYLQEMIPALEAQGIKCIVLSSLIKQDLYNDSKYLNKEYFIPTKYAWEKITPIITEKLDL